MKKALLLLKNFIFIFIVIALFSYIICMKFYPDKMKELTGFQKYGAYNSGRISRY